MFSVQQVTDQPQFECDLLHNKNVRNSSGCVMVDSPDQTESKAQNVLLLQLNIRSIPAYLDEFEIMMSSITKGLCTVIGISEI